MNYNSLIDRDTLYKFDDYFSRNLFPMLVVLEKKRKILLFFYLFIAFLGFISFGFYFWIETSMLLEFYKYQFWLLLFFAFCIFLLFRFYSTYKKNVKNYVNPAIINFLSFFKFYAEYNTVEVEESYIKNLYLFENFKNIYIKDSFNGIYKSSKINILELSLEYRKVRGERITIFSGLFIKLTLNNLMTGKIVIKPKQQNLFSFFINAFVGKKRMYKTSSTNFLFGKYYDVYYFDIEKILINSFLTDSFMQKMIEIASKKSELSNISVSFENNGVHIAIPSKKNWFEFPMFKSLLKIEHYYKVLDEFLSIFSIIDTIYTNDNLEVDDVTE